MHWTVESKFEAVFILTMVSIRNDISIGKYISTRLIIGKYMSTRFIILRFL